MGCPAKRAIHTPVRCAGPTAISMIEAIVQKISGHASLVCCLYCGMHSSTCASDESYLVGNAEM